MFSRHSLVWHKAIIVKQLVKIEFTDSYLQDMIINDMR